VEKKSELGSLTIANDVSLAREDGRARTSGKVRNNSQATICLGHMEVVCNRTTLRTERRVEPKLCALMLRTPVVDPGCESLVLQIASS
jgi:hypothetical protein